MRKAERIVKHDGSSKKTVERGGRYVTFSEKRAAKEEEERKKEADRERRREEFIRELEHEYRYHDDDHPFHGGEGSCG